MPAGAASMAGWYKPYNTLRAKSSLRFAMAQAPGLESRHSRHVRKLSVTWLYGTEIEWQVPFFVHILHANPKMLIKRIS